jgi:hypothetical protein
MIDRALEFLERAFVGEHPKLLFEIQGHGRADPRAPEARGNPGKVLDPHWHSVAVRNVIFAPGLLEFLHLIFERRVMASQTLGFVRGWQQGGHQDSAYVNYSLPMQFAACWIALEDVKEGAGEVFYHVGSHRIGEYRFHNRFKGVSEAQRLGFSETVTEAQTAQHAARISEQVKGLGLPARTYRAKRGDVLIWSADLVHGCGASFGQVSSKHLLAHYCPAESAPWYFERGICQIRKHGEEFYSSGHYEK